MQAFEIKNLSFSYRKNDRFLQDISFSVDDNQIFGLLGHNGSGKSTLLKLICGLMYVDYGEINFYGIPLAKYAMADLYQKIGVLIEKSVFYGHLTVFENLNIITRYRHIGKNRITEVLEEAGMKNYLNVRANQLSTGMKQRMGMAAALIHDPKILILDEPTNGLDPEGIIEIRNLLRYLKSEGKTLIVSSHILSEMEKICDQLIILKNGRSVYSGSLMDLIRNRHEKEIKISATPRSKMIEILTTEGLPFRFDNDNILVDIEHTKVPDLLKKLLNKNIRIDNVNFSVKTLEDLYISLN